MPESNVYSPRKIAGELFSHTPIPKISLEAIPSPDLKLPEPRKIPVKLQDTSVGRFLVGKNFLGKIVFGLLDIALLPNFHEIVKKVIKEADSQGLPVGYKDVIIEAIKRADGVRTFVAIIGAIILLLGAEWTGIEIEKIQEIAQWLVEVLKLI